MCANSNFGNLLRDNNITLDELVLESKMVTGFDYATLRPFLCRRYQLHVDGVRAYFKGREGRDYIELTFEEDGEQKRLTDFMGCEKHHVKKQIYYINGHHVKKQIYITEDKEQFFTEWDQFQYDTDGRGGIKNVTRDGMTAKEYYIRHYLNTTL